MRARLAALLVVVVVAGAACVSTPKDRSVISLRKSSLSLAFSDPALEKPLPPEIIQRIIPFDAPDLPTIAMPDRSVAPASLELCPAPPPGAQITETAHLAVRAPTPGTYLRHNTGTIVLQSGTLELTLPYPTVTTMTVSNVRTQDDAGVAGTPIGAGLWTHFEVLEQLAPGFTDLVEYRFNIDAIQLVRRVSTSPETTSTFVPDPPIDVLQLKRPGTAWRAAGVDVQSGVARAVSGTIGAPERIPLCGSVVEAVPGTLDVYDASVGDGAALDGTIEPLVQHWVPQFGGLIARQDLHASELVQTDDGAVRVTYDVVSTLMSVEPR